MPKGSVNFKIANPIESLNISCFASSQFFPDDLRTRMDDLVDGEEVGAVMKFSIGDPLGKFNLKNPTKGVVLNSLELVKTGDGCGIEGDARVCKGSDD